MIRSGRITLRHVAEADLPLLIRFANDSEARGEFALARLVSPAALRARFSENGFSDEKHERFMICDEQGEVIGDVLHFQAKTYSSAREIGWVIYEARHRRRGYATEAVGALVDYLFKAYPINRVECATLVENLASVRLAERCGLLREGLRRGALFVDGRYVDDLTFGLLRADWERLREQQNGPAGPSGAPPSAVAQP